MKKPRRQTLKPSQKEALQALQKYAREHPMDSPAANNPLWAPSGPARTKAIEKREAHRTLWVEDDLVVQLFYFTRFGPDWKHQDPHWQFHVGSTQRDLIPQQVKISGILETLGWTLPPAELHSLLQKNEYTLCLRFPENPPSP